MTELFVNYIAQTTLADAIDPVQTTLEIIPVAASPSVPQFRIRVDNEIMLVTAIAGATYTVVRGIEGTEKTAHDRVIVHYILTAAALGGQSDPAPTVPGLRSLGTGANQAAAGNDPRFTAASIPTAHAATHHSGGSDPLAGQSIAGLLTSSTPQFAGLRASGDVTLSSTGRIAWVPGSDLSAAPDVALQRGEGNMVIVQGGSGSNPKIQVGPGANSNALHLWADFGPGVGPIISSIGGASLNLSASATYFSGNGYIRIIDSHLIPYSDNTHDFGINGAVWRTGYFGTAVALSSSANLNWNGDTFLIREGPSSVVLRNGATNQYFGTYEAYSDGSNYSKLSMTGSLSGGPALFVQAAGIYAGSRNLLLSAATAYGGSGYVIIYDSALQPNASNSKDLGASNAQWRTGYFGTSVALSSGANLNWNGDTFLIRLAPNALAIRNGTARQQFQIFDNYTDDSNQQKLAIAGGSSIGGAGGPVIQVEAIGVFTGNPSLILSANPAVGGSGLIIFYQSHLIPADGTNLFDLGRSTNVWRTGYFGTAVVNSGYNEFIEMAADAAAGATNTARLYCKDNGSGKTQLCVRFATGAVQVLSTEP